jgi:hypothetical protein
MTPLPHSITEFIASLHVVSVATLDADGLWSASCFYAFDVADANLVLLSSADTRHGAAMLADGRVSGTISGQPKNLRDIRGVQFSARAERLDGVAKHAALRLYTQRHPLAKLKTTDVWLLHMDEIKFTDNYSLFGHKTRWSRQAKGADA